MPKVQVMMKPVVENNKESASFLFDIAPFFTPTLLFLAFMIGYQLSPNGNPYLVSFVIYASVPFYNKFILDDADNLRKSVERKFAADWRFNIPLWTCIFVHTAGWAYLLMLYSEHYQDFKKDNFWFRHVPRFGVEGFGHFASYSFFTALSQSAGHELIHRREIWHKVVGSIPFFTYYYTHFGIEHTQGHHKDIATPEDAVFPARGTNIYVAMAQAWYRTHISTWFREAARIEKHFEKNGKKPSLVDYCLYNLMFAYFVMHAGLTIFIYKFFGWGGLWFQTWHVVSGVFWTEMINYLEHYGLSREVIGTGDDGQPIYESIDGFASWNAPASTVGFKIQRHSDHHCHGFRPYQILRHYEDVPAHPFEYMYMLFLALVPPVFYYVTHPRIDAVNRAKKGIKVEGEED